MGPSIVSQAALHYRANGGAASQGLVQGTWSRHAWYSTSGVIYPKSKVRLKDVLDRPALRDCIADRGRCKDLRQQAGQLAPFAVLAAPAHGGRERFKMAQRSDLYLQFGNRACGRGLVEANRCRQDHAELPCLAPFHAGARATESHSLLWRQHTR